jgi:Ca2+-binding EF-hand superfamily protein
MNKTFFGVIATGCLMLAVVASEAQAQGGMMPPGGGMGPGGMKGKGGMMGPGHWEDWMFDEMDANHDGVVTKREFDDYHAKWFKELDANHDGKISREELEAFHQNRAQRMRDRFKQRFDAADANHDGALSREEAQSIPFVARNFDAIDANHDGKVTLDEIWAAHGNMGGPGNMPCGPYGGAASGVPGGMMPGGRMMQRGGMMQP